MKCHPVISSSSQFLAAPIYELLCLLTFYGWQPQVQRYQNPSVLHFPLPVLSVGVCH